MDNKEHIVELVKRFIAVADELLIRGEIDKDIYRDITLNKIKFLKQVAEENI